MTTRIKICGIRTLPALSAAVDGGADFVGFVYYPPSPRHLAFAEMASLARALPERVQSVVVTVNAGDDMLGEMLRHFTPAYVQLHGSESPERVRHLRTLFPHLRLMKAIAVGNARDIAEAEQYVGLVDMLLFDAKPTPDARLPGGNGAAFNWALTRGPGATSVLEAQPWLLSGGLTVENVQQALTQSGAAGVDVSSGVESAPGVKDARKIRAFCAAVRSYKGEGSA